MADPTIRTMTPEDVAKVSALADALVGRGYYPPDAVAEMLKRSTLGEVVCSHVAETSSSELVGFRFALPPGRWNKGRGDGLSPELWPAARETCAYFQTAYVHPRWRGRGVGSSMASQALAALTSLGAEAVVTHSWKESPDNSSSRYLSRLGFVAVCEHRDYWRDVDYECVRDGRPCRCTAVEMVLSLTRDEAF